MKLTTAQSATKWRSRIIAGPAQQTTACRARGSVVPRESGELPSLQPDNSSSEDLVQSAADALQPVFRHIDITVARNLRRVQRAFHASGVETRHICGSKATDMSHSWRALDAVVANIMGTEAALCRLQIMSGTHAIACALYGVLRPGDKMLAVTGPPYDTLEEVIGSRGTQGIGSLKDFDIDFESIPLTSDGSIDFEAIIHALRNGKTRVCHIQRSCGYSPRPTLTIAEIRRTIEVIKSIDPATVCIVDNCYGEFTEPTEPGHAGADLVMGSLIKNPGGTMVTAGGYIAGRKYLIKLVEARFSAPGVDSTKAALTGRQARTLFQGLWLAPCLVAEALKGGKLIAKVLELRGYQVKPAPQPSIGRPSFITAIKFGSAEAMISFCEGIQGSSPVGSYIKPTPGVTPGYEHEVIFADGTFIDGSTAELSADGPVRPPYVVYCQGGTHWTHWANVLSIALDRLDDL